MCLLVCHQQLHLYTRQQQASTTVTPCYLLELERQLESSEKNRWLHSVSVAQHASNSPSPLVDRSQPKFLQPGLLRQKQFTIYSRMPANPFLNTLSAGRKKGGHVTHTGNHICGAETTHISLKSIGKRFTASGWGH